MIQDFIGEFLFHPAPLEFSGNTCSHDCCYCFANIRKTERVLGLKSIINQMRRTEVKTYQDALFYEGYPICMSNRTDPFSETNYLATIALGYEFAKIKNGIFIQTKGGKGIDEFLKAINYKKEIVWYITITTVNENTRKRIETNAPTVDERFELARKLKSLGYLVIIALNPVLEQWMPLTDLERYMKLTRDAGINHICTEALHIDKIDLTKMSQRRIDKFTPDELEYASNRKGFQGYVKKVIPALRANGFHVMKLGMPFPTDFFADIKKVFPNIFPNQYDIINFAHATLKSGIVTFDDFYNVSVDNKPFFEKNFKYVNKYVLKAGIHVWGASKEAKEIFSLKGVLKFIWNNPIIKSSMCRNQAFRMAVDNERKHVLDGKGNIQLYFDRGIYPTERIINIKNCKHENIS